jgi:hypothetical protein
LTTNVESISKIIPIDNTIRVVLLTPFHSFRKIPHILLIAMFSAIRILHPKTAMPWGSLLEPIPKKWNCRNHKNPARNVKNRLFRRILPDTV